ncbi:MAG: hypothetical protein ACHRXM_32085 [Isosphaerales bacterium]
MTSTAASSRSRLFFVLTALSLSLGWGIRGNFGHEYGAMIPGALAAMAAVLLSGRVDWQRRIVYFAMFGALGWSFGGSISYMQVVAYTHSGHSPSVLYGFACLFVIGFLWAALGGAGTALPAVVDQSFLSALFPPIYAVFLIWWLQGVAIEPLLRRQGYNLNWYDTDWLAALLALFAVLLVAGVRRRLDGPTSLILHLAAGWWAGFLVLVLALDLRMTPPRGDNWAGCVGMTVGLLWYCRRAGLFDVARAALVCGFVGGIGFALASMLKLVEVTSGYQTNWHSILEQTTGLFNGIGLATAVAGLARWSPSIALARERRPATEPFALGFVLLGITYLNLRKNVAQWVAAKAMPAEMAGVAAWVWFELGYVLLALSMLALFLRHRQRPLPIVPESWLGKGQLLYVGFLWWLVAGNFVRALVSFEAERLVTEGVIYLVALACTLILLLSSDSARTPADQPPPALRGRMGLTTLVAVGLVAAILSIVADWAVVRAIYGDQFAGHAGLHIRFGPKATINQRENR